MPSCEVQRTLVKSPPELWAELSEPASLAKHLGEFGEIRIARIEPEITVEWEATAVRGAVQLKASGWGTKVTLTAVREVAEPEAPPEKLALPEVEAIVEPGAQTSAEPEPEPEPESPVEFEAAPQAETVAEPELERRPGLFARIFRRRRSKAQPTPEAEPAITEDAAPLEEPPPLDELEPVIAEEPEERPDLAAELAAVEQTLARQDAALLTAVLDRLGAAHHRPFSRG